MPSLVMRHWEEYRYCKDIKPGLTHEQFLDEPADTVTWLLHIDDTVTAVKNKAARKSR